MPVELNIKNVRKSLGISQKKMAERCGVDIRTVQNWESGYSKPSAAVLALIQSWGAPMEYESLSQEGEGSGPYFTYLLPMSAAGGSLAGFQSEGARLVDCERIVSPIEDVDFAITVYGDSMYPDFPSGSRILIKKVDPDAFIAWGNVYVLDTVNGVIVKEVQPSDHEGKLLCHSLNPSGRYKDFEVTETDVRAMYRVLACVTMK